MYVFDTNELPAVLREDATHYKRLKKHDTDMLEKFIEGFVNLCRGNGDINVVITGGKIRFFEPRSKVSADDEPKKTA